jgi:hypothetical protein
LPRRTPEVAWHVPEYPSRLLNPQGMQLRPRQASGTLSSRPARHARVFQQYARKREAGGVPLD